jgi:hypothetical protein
MIKAHLETLASLFLEKDLARKRKRETKENNISDANVVPCRKINPAYISLIGQRRNNTWDSNVIPPQ